MQDFIKMIKGSPVVASVAELARLNAAVRSPCEIIFLLRGSILNIQESVQRVHEAGKMVLIHFDLVDGFSRDISALKYIKQEVNPDGIITTRANLIKHAQELGLNTIQRVFMLDSLSVESAIRSISSTQPTAIELLPGVIPRVLQQVSQETQVPIIAGGLIESKADIIAALQAGAVGISATKEELWYL